MLTIFGKRETGDWEYICELCGDNIHALVDFIQKAHESGWEHLQVITDNGEVIVPHWFRPQSVTLH